MTHACIQLNRTASDECDAKKNDQLCRDQALNLVINGLNSIREGILRYHKLGLTIKDLYADLEKAGWRKSLKTLQNTQAELRKEGLLPDPKQGARNDLKGSSRNQEPPGQQLRSRLATTQLSQPTDDNHSEPYTSPLDCLLNLSDLQSSFREPSSEMRLQSLQRGEQTHPDYNKIIQLFEQINDLTHANESRDSFCCDEWFSILGSWQGSGCCIRANCDYIARNHSRDLNRSEAISEYKMLLHSLGDVSKRLNSTRHTGRITVKEWEAVLGEWQKCDELIRYIYQNALDGTLNSCEAITVDVLV